MGGSFSSGLGAEYALSPAGRSAWRLAPVLAQLLTEIDAAYPLRSRLSDGTIGDPDHQARNSDHNPDQHGYVRAVDLTADPHHGFDPWLMAEYLRHVGLTGSQRIALGGYVIYDRHIASARTRWVWTHYSGDNPHIRHIHLSCSRLPHFYCITRPWKVLEGLEDAARRAHGDHKI